MNLGDAQQLKIQCAGIAHPAEWASSSSQAGVQEAATLSAVDVHHAGKVSSGLKDVKEAVTRFAATAHNARLDIICREAAL